MRFKNLNGVYQLGKRTKLYHFFMVFATILVSKGKVLYNKSPEIHRLLWYSIINSLFVTFHKNQVQSFHKLIVS